jgi:hypothetical protein
VNEVARTPSAKDVHARFLEIARITLFASDLDVTALAGWQAGYDACLQFHGINPLAGVVLGETEEDCKVLGQTLNTPTASA